MITKWGAVTVVSSLLFFASVSAGAEEITLQNLAGLWSKRGFNFSRVYSDDEIEFYQNFQNESFTVSPSFNYYSDIWRKAKEFYKSSNFGHDPKLYVVMYKKSDDTDTAIFKNASSGLLNLIFCEENYENTDALFQCQSEQLVNKIFDVMTKRVVSSHDLPKHLVSEWGVHYMIWRTAWSEIGKPTGSAWSANTLRFNITGFVQEDDDLITDWYSGRFDEGDTFPIHVFLLYLARLCQLDNSLKTRRIPVGEFVQIWSQFKGRDLRQNAYGLFGWTKEYEKEYQRAKQNYPLLNYKDTFTANFTSFPALYCLHNLIVEQHVRYCWKHTHAAYVTKPVSEAWSYLRSAYGPFGPDPESHLDVWLFHNVSHLPRCNINQNLFEYSGKRQFTSKFNVIYCVDPKGTDPIPFSYFHFIGRTIQEIAHLALARANETGNWPARGISGGAAVHFLVYDIFKAVLELNDYANMWAKELFDSKINAPNNDTFWSRDWFFPIYTHFGGARALNAFHKQLNAHWPKHRKNYVKQLSAGDFVHFWSAAVDSDLRSLAAKTFGWTLENRQEFEQARREFREYNYTDTYINDYTFPLPQTWNENLFGHKKYFKLVKNGSDVAFFMENESAAVVSISQLFQLMIEAWSYVKQTYGHINSDPNLYVLLQKGKWNKCITSSPQNNFNERSVVYCKFNSSLTLDESLTTQHMLVHSIATLLLQSLTSQGKSSLLPNLDWRRGLSDILVYDIYSQLRRNESFMWEEDKSKSGTLDLKQWFPNKQESSKGIFGEYSQQISEPKCKSGTGSGTKSRSSTKLNLFRDWYLHLYKKYGGTKIVQKFILILFENIPLGVESKVEMMSVAEFVHFWSGATGINLETFAVTIFCLDPRFYRRIDRARRRFPKVKYSEPPDSPKTKIPPKLSNSGPGGNPSKTKDLIVGISVPVCLIILGLVATLFIRQRMQINSLKKQNRKLTQGELKDFFDGASHGENAHGNDLIQAEPFNKEFEISKDALQLQADHILGSGEYGLVLKGILKLTDPPGELVAVAVKTPKPDVDVTTFKALLSELKVMGHIGSHDNVIRLLGAVTINIKNRELLVALEFCPKGDLLSFMRRNREDFIDLFKKVEPVAGPSTYRNIPAASLSSYTNVTETKRNEIELQSLPSTSINYENMNNEFTAMHLLEWSRQIANGMNFISTKNVTAVIHGDLAARNVLLTADRVAKISDFGLSRQLVNYTNYVKKSDTAMPWRWMALESLQEMNFSTKSDVWGFGVTLYEIFSLGSIPYPGGNWTHEFVDQISSGYRLSTPRFGNEEIHDLMLSCMKKEPSERLDFSAITFKLQNLKTKLFPQSCADRADCIYIDINAKND